MKILKNKIADTVAKFDKNKDFYEKNETATRDQLINPILMALGWDTTNPDLVRPNERDKGFKIPDYKMLKEANTVLVLEAKKAALQISTKEITQLCTYIYTENVNFGLISNGLYWALLEKNSKAKIWELDLRQTQDNWETETRLLLNVAYDNVENLENSIKKNALLEQFYAENLANQSIFIAFLHQQILKIDTKIDWQIDEISSFLNKKGFFQTTEPTNNSAEIEIKQVAQAIPNKPTLKVTFSDGEVFYYPKASETFVAAIKKIGLAKVVGLDLQKNGYPLLHNQNPNTMKGSVQWHNAGNGFWINTHSSTPEKIKVLENIKNAFSLDFIAEII